MELLTFDPSPADVFQLPSSRSASGNATLERGGVSFFLIEGLSGLGDIKTFVFALLLLGYIVILGGNGAIIFVVRSDPRLASPMFFFLCNLSLVDVVYTSTTVPHMLSGLVAGGASISVQGCFLQMFLFITLAVTGRAILTVMAYDRYVAICDPLRYLSVMSRPVRLLLVGGAWGFGVTCTLPSVIMGGSRRYCGPHVVKHGWCDPGSVRRLACEDTWRETIVSLTFGVVAMLTTGVLILVSYIMIGLSVYRMGVAEGLKAFRTCAAHLTVVTISYAAAACVYISYRAGNVPPQVRIGVSLLYSALTPFLNPIIYSLRNGELRDAIRRALSKLVPATVRPAKHVATAS